MDALAIERNPVVIAAEINSIKDQTRKMLLFNSIEIGRRLLEAKSLVPHGEWGNWLEEKVEYSQSTANNLMRIFEEYGSKQLSIFDNNANSQALGNLSYTQAVALLSIPQHERGQFIEEHDIENMSTRELQQAIKEKQELEEKLKQAQKEAEDEKHRAKTISDSYDRLEKVNQKHYEEVTRLRKEIEEAEDSGNEEEVERLHEELKQAQKQIENLSEQLKTPQVIEASVIEKVPDEIERELQELREKAKELDKAKADQQNSKAILKFGVQFETLVKGFQDLLGTLNEIKEADPDAYDKYQNAVTGLIGKMSEKLA